MWIRAALQQLSVARGSQSTEGSPTQLWQSLGLFLAQQILKFSIRQKGTQMPQMSHLPSAEKKKNWINQENVLCLC